MIILEVKERGAREGGRRGGSVSFITIYHYYFSGVGLGNEAIIKTIDRFMIVKTSHFPTSVEL